MDEKNKNTESLELKKITSSLEASEKKKEKGAKEQKDRKKEKKSKNQNKEMVEKKKLRFGSLDFIIILALIILIAFPVARYFFGTSAGKTESTVEVTLLLQKVDPELLKENSDILVPDRAGTIGYIHAISSVDYNYYNTKTNEIIESVADVKIVIRATKTVITTDGDYLLYGEFYINTGRELEIIINSIKYNATVISINENIIKKT